MIRHKKLFSSDNRIIRLIQDFVTVSPYKVGRLWRNQKLPPPVPLRAFATSNHGILAVFFALGAIPLMMAIGAAVDFGRAFTVKAQLGEALDKAALAVALAPKGTKDAALDQIFKGYFDANFKSDRIGAVSSITRTQTDTEVTLRATASVETAFLKVIPGGFFDTIEVAGLTTVKLSNTGLEVALVMDNTGSMAFGSPSRISLLRIAATQAVNVLFGDQKKPKGLKVALIPFVTTVNIGNGNLQKSWVKFPDPDNSYPPNNDNEWKGCVEARIAPFDVRDDFDAAPTKNGPFKDSGEWAPYYWEAEPVRVNNPNSFSFVCQNDWLEPGTPITLPLLTGRTPSNITFPLAKGNVFLDTIPPRTFGPNKACPDPIIPLTNDKKKLLNAIKKMEPWSGNGTMANLGAVWGWRVLSPEEPFSEGLPYSEKNNKKAIIILTDGQNLLSRQSFCANQVNNPRYNTHYSGYGYGAEGRLGPNSRNQINRELNRRLSLVCENIKQLGIFVSTITFQLNDEDTKDIFRKCATSPDDYYPSPDGNTLKSAFNAIAIKLNNLRIAR